MQEQVISDGVLSNVNGSASQKAALAALRQMVLEVGHGLNEVNQVSESLKWGQPSFEATNPKTGSPIRMDALKNSETGYALYFICTTTLVRQFREQYGDQLEFEGNRAIIFDAEKELPKEAVKHCIAMALTYRKNNN